MDTPERNQIGTTAAPKFEVMGWPFCCLIVFEAALGLFAIWVGMGFSFLCMFFDFIFVDCWSIPFLLWICLMNSFICFLSGFWLVLNSSSRSPIWAIFAVHNGHGSVSAVGSFVTVTLKFGAFKFVVLHRSLEQISILVLVSSSICLDTMVILIDGAGFPSFQLHQ